jgi:hypothetical protein
VKYKGVDNFLSSYDAEFIQKHTKDKQIPEAIASNLTFGDMDYVLTINNPNCAIRIPLIYMKNLR